MLVYKFQSGVFLNFTDDGMVILSPSRDGILSLRELESEILHKAIGKTEQQLICEIQDEYDGNGIEEDVHRFLEEMIQWGILRLTVV